MSKMGFFDSVYQVVKLIPSGKITTYGAIARYIGSPQSARMVGYALNGSSSLDEFIPAHRVVNRLGLLTGKRYFGGNSMEELLQAEGIQIKENQIISMTKHFWDPNKELL
jgi:methylated-DNA-protein-cysteine methyltransferase-like protein